MSSNVNKPRPYLKILLPLLAFLCASAARAETVCDGELCAVPLSKNQPAPFSGQLISTELAIKLGQAAEQTQAKIALEIERANGLAKADLELQKKLHQIDLEAAAAREQVLKDRLSVVDAWYRSPIFIAGVTIVGIVGLQFAMERTQRWLLAI